MSNPIVDGMFIVGDDSDDHDRFRYAVHIVSGYCNRNSSTIKYQ